MFAVLRRPGARSLLTFAAASSFAISEFSRSRLRRPASMGRRRYAILLGVILAVRATIRARAAAARIIRFDRDYPEEPGPFGRWFNAQSRFRNSDQMRVDDAVNAFLKAYGGRAVVGYLIREGYEGLIEADLLDVFDVDRAQRVGAGIYSATYRLPWWASLAALVTGGIIGYRATTRR